jgi:hypothetical protein
MLLWGWQWQIEQCPPKSNNHFLMLQKDIKHYYKTKIISKQTYHGIPTSCYVGYWSTTQGVSLELHTFWFCYDDLIRCLQGTSKKYALDRLALPSLWLVQKGTNFIQIEVVTLEEVGFLFLEKPICPLVNSVRDNISAPMNQLSYVPFRIFLAMVLLHLSISHRI